MMRKRIGTKEIKRGLLKEGKIVGKSSDKSINEGKVKTINPATEEVLNEYQIMIEEQRSNP